MSVTTRPVITSRPVQSSDVVLTADSGVEMLNFQWIVRDNDSSMEVNCFVTSGIVGIRLDSDAVDRDTLSPSIGKVEFNTEDLGLGVHTLRLFARQTPTSFGLTEVIANGLQP